MCFRSGLSGGGTGESDQRNISTSRHPDRSSPRALRARCYPFRDDDVTWAVEGDRVGMAIQNIAREGLNRGDVLTNDTSLSSTSLLSSEATIFPYWSQPIKRGMVVHIGSG
jgi:selenocysteine-specific translation elongation factor